MDAYNKLKLKETTNPPRIVQQKVTSKCMLNNYSLLDYGHNVKISS